MNPTLLAQKPYPMAELTARKPAILAAGKTLYDFGTGDPIEPTPRFICEAIKQAVPSISQYPTVAGEADLLSSIADYVERRFQSKLDPQTQILPSAGSKESIFHLPLAFLDPSTEKDTVIYGTPAYPVYRSGTLYANGHCHEVALSAENNFELDLATVDTALLDRCQIAWINYPHNPTGSCVSKDYLQRQVDICRAHQIILVADECYADMWFDHCATPPPSLLECTTEHILVVHSCSKRSGMTGYRSGFLAGDAKLIAHYKKCRAAMGVASPIFVQAAAGAAWAEDEHVIERRQLFSAKRKLLIEGLEQRDIDVCPSDAGLYIWAKVPNGLSSDAYAEQCLEKGIVISPGGFFGAGGEGYFRIALVPSLEDCRAALEQWV